MKGDRLILHTVHTDDGATEVYWSRASDDHPEEREGYEGSILLHDDGSFTFKCWSGAAGDEFPFVAHVMGNRIVVAQGEDQPPSEDEYVFDSNAYPRRWSGADA